MTHPHPPTAVLLAVVLAVLPAPPDTGRENIGSPPLPLPASGPLDLDQLIRLALETNPGIVRLRGEILIATAEERAAHDLRDPEVRLAFRRDRDVELPPSESETRTVKSRQSGTQDRRESNSGGGSSSSSTRKGKFKNETTETTTRRVDHGATSDRITETTRESASESFNATESGTKASGKPFSESLNRTTRERITGSSIESRDFDYNRTDPDANFVVKVRLRLPNPWQRKAKINRAKTKITLAQAVLHAAQHDLVIDVRRAYAKIKKADSELSALRHLVDVREKLYKEVVDMGPRAQLDDLIDAEGDFFRADLEQPVIEAEIDEAAADLAALCGLNDPSRISFSSSLTPRALDLDNLDPDFLYQIAEGYRADLLELLHRAKMSEFELQGQNARKIPWFSFIDAFYGNDWNRGNHASDNWGVQLGITLPLFSWFKNKEHEIYQQELASLNRRAAAVRARIHTDIDTALANFKRVDNRLSSFGADYQKRRAALEDRIKKTRDLGVRARDARFRAEEAFVRLEEIRADVGAIYNDALLKLERAIGADLDEVFSSGKSK